MATPDFGSREFWEANALAPKDEYVEWFAGYAELVHVLRCACSPGSTVLHAGCGISSLSQALYDDGFRHQLAVDFSEQCMLRQRELCGPSRPEMGNAVMDCTRLGLRPASVDVCIDKGTLDALLCIDECSEEAVEAMAREVRRVVRPDGLWVIISFNTPSTVAPARDRVGVRVRFNPDPNPISHANPNPNRNPSPNPTPTATLTRTLSRSCRWSRRATPALSSPAMRSTRASP